MKTITMKGGAANGFVLFLYEEEGAKAARRGKSADDNPFAKSGPDDKWFRAWDKGFRSVKPN